MIYKPNSKGKNVFMFVSIIDCKRNDLMWPRFRTTINSTLYFDCSMSVVNYFPSQKQDNFEGLNAATTL